MKEKWLKTQISEVAEIQSGSGFPEKYQGKAGLEYPFYKVSDMNISGNEEAMFYENNSISEKTRVELKAPIFPKGSIIFPKIGGAIATNKKRLITKNSCVDNNVMGIIPNSEKIDSRYLYYSLLQVDLMEFSNKAGLPSIKKSVLETWQIRYPQPIPEQQRIVALLDETFAALATVQANAEKNLVNARELFESYLEDIFENKGGNWNERMLQDVVDANCTLSYGIVQPGEEYSNGLPVIRPMDLTSKVITLDGLKRINPRLADSYKRTSLTGDELLLCVRGSTGVVSVTSKELKGANVTRGIVPIRFNSEFINQEFGYFLLISSYVQKQIKEKTYGTALMQINIGDLRKILTPFPNLKEQCAIVARLEALAAETQRLAGIYRQKLAALEELKKSVLQKAFAGEL